MQLWLSHLAGIASSSLSALKVCDFVERAVRKNLRLIGEVTGSEPEMKNESGGEKIQE